MKTMKTIAIFTLSLIVTGCILFAYSCDNVRIKGNKNIVENEVQIEDYNEINFAGKATIIYEQKTDVKPYFRIETDENIFPLIKIESTDSVLRVYSEEESKFISPTKCNIYTNSTSLRKIVLAGSVECNLQESIAANSLKIEVAGSVSLKADSLTCLDLNIECSGSTTIGLKGEAENVICEAAGISTLNLYDLKVQNMDCDMAGSGKMETWVEKKLDVEIAGSGKVFYKGDPQVIKEISGLGKVRKANE